MLRFYSLSALIHTGLYNFILDDPAVEGKTCLQKS